MSAILAAVLATTVYPWTCDWNWWRGKQLQERMRPWSAPRGISYSEDECRLAIGWTHMLADERLWVFSGRPCGLEDRRTRTSHVVGREVSLESWVLSADAWRFPGSRVISFEKHTNPERLERPPRRS